MTSRNPASHVRDAECRTYLKNPLMEKGLASVAVENSSKLRTLSLILLKRLRVRMRRLDIFKAQTVQLPKAHPRQASSVHLTILRQLLNLRKVSLQRLRRLLAQSLSLAKRFVVPSLSSNPARN